MLDIKNINKYFNRHKSNQIHVIDNTSISFPNTGLVTLLGESGSGKTTLLNVIGGLDKRSKGKIYYNGKKISKNNIWQIDKFRAINIGYIFQDYKLLDNKSVYENIALVLRMIGIKNKKIIKERVEYALEKVDMLRYAKRPANMLSGGERQRVGIARAIVKNPSIILADEPTGNLDSKNTIEIMNIIKTISKDKLVILVTHEQNLAKFYSSRIIEIVDGKIIKDYINKQNDGLDYYDDTKIYLKDLKKVSLKDKDNNINIYKADNENININIVIKNGNLYIESKNQEILKVGIDTPIELIDKHFKKINNDDIDKNNFDFTKIDNSNHKIKYSSVFSFLTYLKEAFIKVFNYSVFKKLLLIGFFIAGIFITYAICSIEATNKVYEEDYVTIDRNYLILNKNSISPEEYNDISNIKDVKYVIPTNSKITLYLNLNNYYQTVYVDFTINGSLSDISNIKEQNLIYGSMPTNEKEIIVDKQLLKKAIKQDEYRSMAITKIKDFLNKTITIDGVNTYTIVGISDLKSPCIYINKQSMEKVIIFSKDDEDFDEKNTKVYDYTHYTGISLLNGRMPTNDYEIIVQGEELLEKERVLNKVIEEKINNHNLVIVGYYKSETNLDYYFSNYNTYKYQYLNTTKQLAIYTDKKLEVMEILTEKGYSVKDQYQLDKDKYNNKVEKQKKSNIILSIIMISISLIEIFLMIRSSFLSRIKEIGIYRAIGIRKIDIYKMFSSEIFAITTIGGVPGIIITSYVLNELIKISYISRKFIVNPKTIIYSIIGLYLFNLIIGLLPVFRTLRKRPAQILSRTDI